MPTSRIPLTQPIENRGPDFSKDSRGVNCYFETRDQKREIIKRPGLDYCTTITTATIPNIVQGQGLAEFRGQIIAVIDNKVWKVDPVTYDQTYLGVIQGQVEQVSFTKDFLDNNLFFHNAYNFYSIDKNWILTHLTSTSVASTTVMVTGSGFTTSSTVTFTAPPTGGVLATGDAVISGGGILSVIITNPGSGYLTAPTFIVTGGTVNASGTSVLNVIPDPNFAVGTVFLDQYVFVGCCNNRIYNSYLNDCNKWDALSYISFEQSTDRLLGIAKHLNYLVAFGEWSIQFYYDAGTTPGSPLAVASSYMSEIGLAAPGSLVQTEQSIIWVGRSRSNGPGVYVMDGTSPIRISSHGIERVLQASCLDEVTAYTVKVNGHMFYILTLHDLNVTMVFDLAEKVWYQWTMWTTASNDQPDPTIVSEGYFRPCYYCQANNDTFVLDDDNGVLYKLNTFKYSDVNTPIYFRSVTDIMDSGTTKRKFYNRVEVIGDKVPGTLLIRHTGDDYNNWSKYREVNLMSPRCQIYQTGSDRRRAWEIFCTENVPLRLDSIEVDFSVGELDQDSQVGKENYRR